MRLCKEAAIKPPSGQAIAPGFIKPSFDVVSADEAGMLVAAGKAQPSAAVLLQNGAQTLGETKADANGEWVLTPEHALPPGAYKLSLLSVHPKTQERVPGEHSFALTIAPRRKEAPGSGQTLAARPPGAVTSAPAAAPVATRGQPKRPGKLADVKRGDTLGNRSSLLRQRPALQRDRRRQQRADQGSEFYFSETAARGPGR